MGQSKCQVKLISVMQIRHCFIIFTVQKPKKNHILFTKLTPYLNAWMSKYSPNGVSDENQKVF